jgi:hypothetical protein
MMSLFTERPTDATDRTHTFYPLQPGFPNQPAYGARAGRICGLIGTALLGAGLLGLLVMFLAVAA